MSLFEMLTAPAPADPGVEAFVRNVVKAPEAEPEPRPLDPATIRALKQFEGTQRANEIRRRMRPRPLVKVFCDHWSCSWEGKMMPLEVPQACPGCNRVATMTVRRFVSR